MKGRSSSRERALGNLTRGSSSPGIVSRALHAVSDALCGDSRGRGGGRGGAAPAVPATAGKRRKSAADGADSDRYSAAFDDRSVDSVAYDAAVGASPAAGAAWTAEPTAPASLSGSGSSPSLSARAPASAVLAALLKIQATSGEFGPASALEAAIGLAPGAVAALHSKLGGTFSLEMVCTSVALAALELRCSLRKRKELTAVAEKSQSWLRARAAERGVRLASLERQAASLVAASA